MSVKDYRMTARTMGIHSAASELEPGRIFHAESVPWDEYEELLADFGHSSRLRITYDRGRVEIVAPLPIHEKYKSLIHDLVMILGEESGFDVESLGSTTFKLKQKGRGAEPDDSFYIKAAPRIAGKTNIDLEVDPPPDLFIEIDTTSESVRKLTIYAEFGVPEVWRFDGSKISFCSLVGDHYEEVEKSNAFPVLTTDKLLSFIELGNMSGQSEARRAFRQAVRTLLSS
jgi:Uma2 family endonuclease